MVRQALVICVMVPPIHLGAWSMALMLWLPFELLLLCRYRCDSMYTVSKVLASESTSILCDLHNSLV